MAAVLTCLLRLLVILFGYAVATLAASLFLNVLLLSALDVSPGETPVAAGSLLFAVPVVALFVAYFAFLPAILMVLLGELLGKRDWLFYALSGALVAAVVIGLANGSPGAGYDVAADPAFLLAVIATGIFGGMAYWLVAGRGAGLWRGPAIGSSRDGTAAH